uniref:Putative beta-D-xylosidase 6 n=1 Tax=Aegilops tauschii TaxID=37682 RepID=M8BP17_AEGTA
MWSPNVNISRDPGWGRGQETPGEDPTTASRYGVAFVKGLQGNSSASLLQTSACCKHATAYDLEDWGGVARYNFDARVTAQDLEDTYNPPFRSCVVDGKASCVMCAYTGINGVPACANSDLLTKTVRGDWGLDGYVASDCDAVAIMRDAQRYAPTPEDAVALALKAGLDIDCGTYMQQHAAAAVQQGKITEDDIDKALNNLFAVRMRLGHFDGDPRANIYGGLNAADICTPDHRALALEAAQDGIVLLKNDASILPLDRAAVASAAPNTDLLAGLSTMPSPAAEEGVASYHVEHIGPKRCDQLKFPAVVEVENHGPMDGKHSVLVYLRWANATAGRPAKQLIGFRRQHLKAGEKARLTFDISPCEHFSRVRKDGNKVVDRGSHFLMVDKHEMEITFEV